MSASERLASRIVESSRRTRAIPVGRRVERLLEAAAGLLERPYPLLALGDVTHPDEHAAVGLPGSVDRRLDQRGGSPTGVRQPERHRLGRTLGTSGGQPRGEVDPPRRLDERCEGPPGERADGAPGQLGRLGVGAAHHAAVVERDDGLGEVVEEQAQLGLGVDEAFDGAVEVAGDPPRLEPRDDDGRRRLAPPRPRRGPPPPVMDRRRGAAPRRRVRRAARLRTRSTAATATSPPVGGSRTRRSRHHASMASLTRRLARSACLAAAGAAGLRPSARPDVSRVLRTGAEAVTAARVVVGGAHAPPRSFHHWSRRRIASS